jgi:hypothetical protein
MRYNAIKGEIMDEVTELAVPAYFFTGRHDYVTPSELVRAYCEKIKSPLKKIVWFEHSAHFPFFEKPKKFTEEMLKVLAETHPPQRASVSFRAEGGEGGKSATGNGRWEFLRNWLLIFARYC